MTDYYHRKGKELFCEDVSLRILAEKYGTPLFVYSLGSARASLKRYQEAFKKYDPIIAYAVKANPCLELVKSLAAEGCGADVVSGGELDRALRAGVPPSKIVFAGVGKSTNEMEAGLKAGILMFNVESIPELQLLADKAKSLGKTAPVAIRINPDVDPRTHAYISTGKKESKFGLDIRAAMEAYKLPVELPHIEPIGLHCHIGSQITLTSPFVQAAEKVSRLISEIRELGADIKFLDLGGGLGIQYDDEEPPTPADMANEIGTFLDAIGCRLVLEPGRSMTGPAGVLLTRVHYVKITPVNRYVIVDAAMNDLARPALYDAYHSVDHITESSDRETTKCDIVGPICETGDFLARGRVMPVPVRDDLLSIGCAGAYGMAMSSNYNIRGRAAEILVDGSKHKLVRLRETYEDILKTELEAPNEWN
ncbi:MAG: diaminopimelate decarboxylase [Candidatus Lindowbacteria bacterium]|nr:diaminopimelate decarboxylase [Candidatus Lindowbacteria bacterium]